MSTRKEQTRRDAARVLHSVVATLPLPAAVAAYLRGYADGLDEHGPAGTDDSRNKQAQPPGRSDRLR